MDAFKELGLTDEQMKAVADLIARGWVSREEHESAGRKAADEYGRKAARAAEEHAKELREARLDGALRLELQKARSRNDRAVRACIPDGFLDGLEFGGDGKGAEALAGMIAKMREAPGTSFLFEQDPPKSEPLVLAGFVPAQSGDDIRYDNNPFAEGSLDLTEAGRIFRSDPERARAMARAAGVEL